MLLKDMIYTLQGSYIPIQTFPPRECVRKYYPWGFTSHLYGIHSCWSASIRKRKKGKNIVSISSLYHPIFFASLTLLFPLSLKILQSPLGRPSMHFIQDWGHMGLFIATEKRAKLTNIFWILFWWNQRAVIHCLLG